MRQNTETPAIARIELDTANISSPVEAQSLSEHGVSHSKEVVGMSNVDSPFYLKGWRLRLLKLRSVYLRYLKVKLIIIAL